MEWTGRAVLPFKFAALSWPQTLLVLGDLLTVTWFLVFSRPPARGRDERFTPDADKD